MRLLHFGFKVHDIERAMQGYEEVAGIRWDPVREYEQPPREGETKPNRTKVTHGYTSDGVEIELVQQIEGAAIDDAVLGAREGVSHLAFVVDDLAVERAKAQARGIAIINEGAAPRASWIFLQDDRFAGALVQLVQLNA